jgi:hypothetical protein
MGKEYDEIMAKIERLAKQVDFLVDENLMLQRQKREIVLCLSEITQEVKRAGGQYLADKAVAVLEKILSEDQFTLNKAQQNANGL